MSDLTPALNRISAWMEEKNSFPVRDGQKVAPFKPGLLDVHFTELTHPLPFNFPEALSELYQWHNGEWSEPDQRYSKTQQNDMVDFLYVNPGAIFQLRRFLNEEIVFLSLDSAVSASGWGHASKFDQQPYVPIFSDENGHYSALISEEKESPILVDESAVAFPSLAALMLSIAEMLETHDTLMSSNAIPSSYREKLDLRKELINEVALKYGDPSQLRSASFALSKLLPSW